MLNISGSWEHQGADKTTIEWVRAAWTDMKPFSPGGTYINFQTADEGQDRMEAAIGEALQQLATVNPENVSRMNRNIKPI